MARQNNRQLAIGLSFIFIILLACTPGGGGTPGGAPAGGGGLPAGGGEAPAVEIPIDTEAIGEAAEAAAAGQASGGEIDPAQVGQLAETLAETQGDTGEAVAVDTEQVGTLIDSVTEQTENIDTSSIDTSNIDAGLLAEKFGSVTPDENGNVSLTITEEETNQAIQLALQQSGTDVVSNVTIAYTGGTVVFTGDLEAGSVRAALRPYVENNTLQFEILEASVNDLTIPPATYAVIETTINQTLSEAMGQIPSSVTLTGVSVGEGTLTVTANIQR